MLMLSGCAETKPVRQEAGRETASPASSSSAVPSPSAPAATPSGATAGAPRVVSPDADVYFTSPTRNISCQLTRTAATCDIGDYSYTPPPSPADCDLDFGEMIQVREHSAASFLCHSDTAYSPNATVLNYGETLSNGRFTCDSSAESGIICRSIASRYGFQLSRDRYRLF